MSDLPAVAGFVGLEACWRGFIRAYSSRVPKDFTTEFGIQAMTGPGFFVAGSLGVLLCGSEEFEQVWRTYYGITIKGLVGYDY